MLEGNRGAYVPPDGGDSVWLVGDRITVKLTSEDTGGAYSVAEEITPPYEFPRRPSRQVGEYGQPASSMKRFGKREQLVEVGQLSSVGSAFGQSLDLPRSNASKRKLRQCARGEETDPGCLGTPGQRTAAQKVAPEVDLVNVEREGWVRMLVPVPQC
jgi:hypothetical protein